MLYSVLVDADYCDTARHYGEAIQQSDMVAAEAMTALMKKHDAIVKESTAANELNRLREQLFQDCLAAGERPRGLYTLTAPTGMGKTLSLLAFALRHVQKNEGLRRIFIVLPYLSIMQQNVAVYRSIIPDLLESHSLAELTDETRLTAERWESPLVVTTSVKFFETLFKNRAPDCRPIHQVAQSVVIFDEAQSIPSNLLESTLRALKALRSIAGCSVVLSTATQPSYDMLYDVEWQAEEIVSDVPVLYRAAKRVTYDWRIEKPMPLNALADELCRHPQACVIVNMRRHATQLAKLLQGQIAEDRLFFLTTDLCPKHREKVLEQLRRRLEQHEPCTLIATQCIEAGVDISFPVLYRALAPLESIMVPRIQTTIAK